MRWGIDMAGLKFGSFSQAARISNLDIDADLDMGVKAVIAATGRFTEIDQRDESGINITGSEVNINGTARFTDILITPYTVTPSDNVYFTASITASSFSTSYSPISGSIVIGPTSGPISPRLYVDVEFTATNLWVELRVYKNSDLIGTIRVERYGTDPNFVTKNIDLPELVGGDVLNFTARANISTGSIILKNFRLAGDVVKYVFDGPTAETVI